MHRSLIDHIVMTNDRADTATKCEIMDDSVLNVSRHRPIVCTFKIPACDSSDHIPRVDVIPRINWKKAQKEHIDYYQRGLSNRLPSLISELNLQPHTTADLDTMYDKVVDSSVSVVTRLCQNTKFRSFFKPYWNSELTYLHRNMKVKRREWMACGRPRGGEHLSYSEYKDAKRKFRYCHRLCTEAYCDRLDAEIDKTAEMDSNQFWKLIRRRRKTTMEAGSEIKFDGETVRDASSIVKGWGTYFRLLYTPSDTHSADNIADQTLINEVNNLKNTQHTTTPHTRITIEEVT